MYSSYKHSDVTDYKKAVKNSTATSKYIYRNIQQSANTVTLIAWHTNIKLTLVRSNFCANNPA